LFVETLDPLDERNVPGSAELVQYTMGFLVLVGEVILKPPHLGGTVLALKVVGRGVVEDLPDLHRAGLDAHVGVVAVEGRVDGPELLLKLSDPPVLLLRCSRSR
jgi:hypothetical protein